MKDQTKWVNEMKVKTGILALSCLFLFTGCSQISFEKSNRDQQLSNKQVQHKKQNELALKSVYFNHVKKVDGKNVIQNPANILALVNKNYSLPDYYIPKDLTRPKVSFSFGDLSLEKALLRKEAADALEKMFADAKSNGIELYAVSGYRSYSRQKAVFNAEVSSIGEKKAEEAVAIPGSSEHQTGLAMDISSKTTNFNLTEGFADTAEGKWLAENAYRYGFILRYPKGKEAITVYEFEPWHFRYVGKRAAKIIYQHHWTLEEFFQHVKKS